MSRFGTLPDWIAEYQAIPFRESGRDRDGVDCYGLIYLVMRDRFGVTIPPDPVGAWNLNDRRVDRMALADRVARAKERWRELRRDEVRPGVAILLRVEGRPLHVGVVLNDRAFLHAEQAPGVTVDLWTGPRWSNRVIGFYEWCDRER